MKAIRYIIIPDVHGRTFWRDYVSQYINDPEIRFIFLGDYLDPYPYEEIDSEFKELNDIVELKKQHPGKITLLLGNHDLHYLTSVGRGSRWSWFNAEKYEKFFTENLDLFEITWTYAITDKIYLFSHAGITQTWLNNHNEAFGIYKEPAEDTDEDFTQYSLEELPNFNEMFHNPETRETFFNSLGDVSYNRGGNSNTGSIMWADYHDHIDERDTIPDIIQVFGHTQQEKDPVNIDGNKFCLDCRRGFIIDEDGNLTELDGKEIPMQSSAIMREEEKKRLEKMLRFFI